MKKFAVFMILFCISAILGAAPIIVSKTVRDNPTIELKSSGDAALDREVRSLLNACGWFDLTNNVGDYQLKITSFPGGVRCDLDLAGAPLEAWNVRGDNVRNLAKLIVDHAIERSFSDLKVQGFCTSRIAFCAKTAPGVRNVYACDIDGKNIVQLTNFNALCVEPCWTPNGRSICYSKYGRAGIDLIETVVDGPKRSRILTAYKGINTGAAVSPNGQEIAGIFSFDHQVDLYVKGIFSRQLRRLTKNIEVEASPCWSPDGSRIAYVSEQRGGSTRIVICNRDGSQKKRLPAVGSDAVTPDWSGDDKIVYASRVNGSYTLCVFDLQSGENRRITEEPGSFESPAWAADNRQVVCKRVSGKHSDLVVVDTRTGKVRTLLSMRYELSMPAWSPCKLKGARAR